MLLGGAAALWPAGARAQQSVHVVGVLTSQPLPPVQRFVRKLREYGYVEGENLDLQSRFAQGTTTAIPIWPRSWLNCRWMSLSLGALRQH
jgi:hypothetical protein